VPDELFDEIHRMIQQGGLSHEDIEGLGQQVNAESARLDNERRRFEARIFERCFATPDGQAALALLRVKTIERPPTDAELGETDVAAFALLQARRQGAANLVFQILSAIDFARGIEEEPNV
jgi:hypothetical protein